jgi:hypothetical protein
MKSLAVIAFIILCSWISFQNGYSQARVEDSPRMEKCSN